MLASWTSAADTESASPERPRDAPGRRPSDLVWQVGVLIDQVERREVP